MSHSQSGYLLYVDADPSVMQDTLDAAKRAAAEHIVNNCRLRIESFAAPAPSRVWIYDHDVADWVEQL